MYVQAQLSEGFASENEEMMATHAKLGSDLARVRSELEQVVLGSNARLIVYRPTTLIHEARGDF